MVRKTRKVRKGKPTLDSLSLRPSRPLRTSRSCICVVALAFPSPESPVPSPGFLAFHQSRVPAWSFRRRCSRYSMVARGRGQGRCGACRHGVIQCVQGIADDTCVENMDRCRGHPARLVAGAANGRGQRCGAGHRRGCQRSALHRATGVARRRRPVAASRCQQAAFFRQPVHGVLAAHSGDASGVAR